jgi:nitrite reductase/ring-hydroxylating ferredoxin subunit
MGDCAIRESACSWLGLGLHFIYPMHPYQPPTRRQFVKLFSFGVVTSVISGRNLHASPYYPILINRTTGNQFFALEAKCTHQGCVVPPAGGQCPCHFSRYNLDGTVLVGPAPSPLTSYPITYDGSDLLTIEVPGLGYSVTGSPLETAQGSRFQLTFPTQSGLTYEAQFQENIETAGSAVSFADSANGTANLTSIAGTGGNLSVYIPRTTAKGFYTVNVKVTQA